MNPYPHLAQQERAHILIVTHDARLGDIKDPVKLAERAWALAGEDLAARRAKEDREARISARLDELTAEAAQRALRTGGKP